MLAAASVNSNALAAADTLTDESPVPAAPVIEAPEAQTAPLPEPAAPEPIEPFEVDFEMRYGLFRGDLRLNLKRDEGTNLYSYEVVTRARGMARMVRPDAATESSRFALTATGLQPLQYRLDSGDDDNEDNDSDVRFDWEAGIAHSVYEGTAKELPVEPGVLDRVTADIATIVALRAGREPGGYDMVHRNDIKRYEYRLLGEEQIEVPAGTFDTLKYMRQRPGSSRSILVWYAVDENFLPVRIDQQKNGKTSISTVATELRH